MAKRKKNKARRASKTRGRRISAKAKSTRRATRKAKKAKSTRRKHRVMHCPAVFVEGQPDSARIPERDAQGGLITKTDERACGKTKTKGPRYSYLCEDHKHLSPAAKKAGLLNGSGEGVKGVSPSSSASTTENTASTEPPATPVIAESAEVAVETPPIVTPSAPEEKAELDSEIEAANAADDIPAAATLSKVQEVVAPPEEVNGAPIAALEETSPLNGSEPDPFAAPPTTPTEPTA